ncbi:hypothetical protein BU24DRAFT_431332 [Aaosphaeria arxii CBS 175.79]|uniref:Peptide hydrolase n=1 Tax=Aaosphaeria arxii CBS 175.79 TaxID=1450172 RepID=A0A6A5Y240_9PLEO|nr:uncharacterized protein BU24DRAFT_431332 [Aaosphaeria arxii CBS 175.79]KAF2019582.1 hypothetical protein BU24DRAFT_431332 [Aaosphaeria arxii CBS 175.79]
MRVPFTSSPSRPNAWLTILQLWTLTASLVSAYKPLSDSFLRAIPMPESSDFDIHTGSMLSPILIPRVPGTAGQKKVQEHFASWFQRELPKWTVEWQNSTSRTSISGNVEIPFGNMIIRREPPWTKPGQTNYLTLAAHYDSKYEPEGFIGAIDSAAPCAMLMQVAKNLDKYVTQMYDEMAELGEGGTVEMDMGIQILLLDGEEAFQKWTDTDSLYGARALAEKWATTPNPPSAKFYKYRNPLNQISMFMLLDLLGSAEPMIPSYFSETHWAYQNLATIETRMRELRLLETKPKENFLPDEGRNRTFGGISDDHLPFIKQGVPILHVIPSPFPHVWHKIEDDGEHLDMPTVRDWARIVTAFALEWLDMMEVWSDPGDNPES